MPHSPRSPASAVDRRAFMGGIAGGVLGSITWGAGAAEAAGPVDPSRAARAYKVRLDAARFAQERPPVDHPTNDDEARYANRIGSYSKGLPHDARGEVVESAYEALRRAMDSGDPAEFERIELGGDRPLVNPQAALAFDLQGPDSHALAMRPAPAFASAEQAAEIAENYWMALCRDVPFSAYASDPTAQQAAADLSRFGSFTGPRQAGAVTAPTLFRGGTPADLNGPYVSQFLWQRAPIGSEEVERRMRAGLAGVDYATAYLDWIALQDGRAPAADMLYDTEPHYVRNGRDLAAWVRLDLVWQAYFDALLVLWHLRAPLAASHPYRQSRTQQGFGTFGDPHVATAVSAVATRALKAVWFQKWRVHRRLRPEAFAGRIHNHLTGAAAYPIHGDILTSPVLDAVATRGGTYLLPLAFPEGAPLHPSYGAGHATVAGACVTVLKAFFDESAVFEAPVEATPDGQALQPYQGPPLTVGGELNKLASNIALGRNVAGLHWRSDATESLRLGEAVALGYLAEERFCLNEPFDGFTLTTFDGMRVTV